MSKNLLIVESPNKIKSIKKYLGSDFEVLASFGHVRDLVPKNGAVDPEHDFAMKYEVPAKSKKHIDAIVAAAKEAGAKRALPLPVSVPSHCSLMKPAAEKLAEALKDITIKQPQQFEILFENADLMVINKPAGVLSHATHQSSDDEFTVADFIRQHSDFTTDNYRDGIVHRLDRTTSGVMILAKNQTTADFLKQQFKDRQVHKTYYAVVTGHPKHHQAKIDLPLKRSLKNAGKFVVDASGKPAVTTYQIIKSINHQHLVKLQPQTGRTHQLRVHMSYLNLPILGDYLYGGEKYSRVMLHAETIEFQTPDGQHLTITAPLPSEFAPWQN